jgi:integrase
VLSPEEVRRLIAAAPSFKYRLLLSLTYGCGLRASEVVSLKVCDIDSAQMVIAATAPLGVTPTAATR